jgi:ubiquinol-cytochrome c reductase cytochrome b subunit
VTPPHIVPEWYFLPFYAILRAVPSKLGGVVAMFAAVLVLVFVPWLDTSRVRSAKYRPYYKIAFWFFVFTCVALGWLGSKPAEQPYVFWSQFFTIAYFAFFLIALPVLGLIETPKQLPRSITESVLGRSAGGGAPLPAGAAAAPEKR